MEIKTGIGLDNILFGMSQDNVIAIMGRPDKVVYDHVSNIFKLEIEYYYNRHLVQMNFDEYDRLCGITVFNPDALMFNREIMGKTKSEILDLLKLNGYCKIEDEDYDWFETVWCDEILTDFTFGFNKLKSINFSPLYDDNDEQIWPVKNA